MLWLWNTLTVPTFCMAFVPFSCANPMYDPIKRGHLILFNFGLVIQFHPGSTLLILSGTICHGNIAIQPHKTRQSFTQYCPGGLLCWITYRFQPFKAVADNVKRYFEETHKECQEQAASLFSKLHKLHDNRVHTFNLRGSLQLSECCICVTEFCDSSSFCDSELVGYDSHILVCYKLVLVLPCLQKCFKLRMWRTYTKRIV